MYGSVLNCISMLSGTSKNMFNLNLSPSELKLIRRVVVFSILGCVVLVSGVWLYFNLQLKTDAVSIRKKEKINGSREILPIDMEAHRLIAARYMQTGTPEKAVPFLERVFALNKKDLSVLCDLANASLETGYYREALKYYDLLLKKAKGDSMTNVCCARRGIALYYLNKIEESTTTLLECTRRFPENAEAWCFLGQIEAFRNTAPEKAVEYFSRALSVDSTYTEGWYQMARYYMDKKIYIKARELLLTALSINPFHSKSHSRLGMVYYYLEYPELAKKSYQTAIVLNPDDFNTRYNLGELLYGVLEDTLEALKQYKMAFSLNPGLYEAAFKIGLICMGNGMNKEAVNFFEKALDISPDNIRILLQCAVVWERLGRKDRALALYRKILSLDELHAIARQKLKLLEDVDR